jgi:hypothetical protein
MTLTMMYAVEIVESLIENLENSGEPSAISFDQWVEQLERSASRHGLDQEQTLQVFEMIPKAVSFVGGMSGALLAADRGDRSNSAGYTENIMTAASERHSPNNHTSIAPRLERNRRSLFQRQRP